MIRNGAAAAFDGEFKGASWNAQALFARDPARQHAKQLYVEHLLASHDFVLLQETHSSPAAIQAWRGFGNAVFFRAMGIQLLVV